MVEMGEGLQRLRGYDMGRVSGAVHGQILSRDCEACQGSGVPRAEVGSDDSDGLRG